LPTGPKALITLIHHASNVLAGEPYAHIISLDFSKAFDVARHNALFERLSTLPLPDDVYAWLLDFFYNRLHRTKFNSVTSSALDINCGVVQGSALGPIMFLISSSDLHLISPGIYLCK